MFARYLFLARTPGVTANSGVPAVESCFMQIESDNQRLSVIPTLWSLVYLAHHGPADAAKGARLLLHGAPARLLLQGRR